MSSREGGIMLQADVPFLPNRELHLGKPTEGPWGRVTAKVAGAPFALTHFNQGTNVGSGGLDVWEIDS